MVTSVEDIYKQFLNQIEIENPELAEKIKAQPPELVNTLLYLVAQKQVSSKKDLASINVGINYKLEKFEGEVSENSIPYEVIEGKDN